MQIITRQCYRPCFILNIPIHFPQIAQICSQINADRLRQSESFISEDLREKILELLFFQPVGAAIFCLQEIIIVVCFLKKIAEGPGAIFFGHIQVVYDAAKNDVLLDTTQHQSIDPVIFL